MKIGILGAGTVGESLGKALIKAGHEVMFSSRDPNGEHAQRVNAETGASLGLPAEVISANPVIAIAMSPEAVLQVVREHAAALKDKIIIDMNNRFGPSASGLTIAQDIAALSGGKVVKAFNTIGAEHYQNPVFSGQAATLLIAGDDAHAKSITAQLAGDIGFEVIDAGGLDAAGLLEQFARLWVYLARNVLGRDFAFGVLRR